MKKETTNIKMQMCEKDGTVLYEVEGFVEKELAEELLGGKRISK